MPGDGILRADVTVAALSTPPVGACVHNCINLNMSMYSFIYELQYTVT